MKTVTLRNLPSELARIIRKKADEQHASLNKVVIGLLEQSVGVRGKSGETALYHDLDALAGSWTQQETAAFNKALAKQRTIDPDLWQ